ncbi:MAG: hypothetical protein Q9196_007391 [Gyalolechia fulgens]
MPRSKESRTKPATIDGSIRMLVLETDEQHPDDHRESGTFGDVLDDLFKKAGHGHDPPLGIETIVRFIVEEKGGSVPKAADIQDIHAILITGSMFDAHGDNPWILKLVDLIQSNLFFFLRLIIPPKRKIGLLTLRKSHRQLSGSSAPISASAASASAIKSSAVRSGRKSIPLPIANGNLRTPPLLSHPLAPSSLTTPRME